MRILTSLLSCSLAAAQSLTTGYTSTSGLAGNMFDLHGLQPVLLNAFDVDVDPGFWTIAVYRVTGGGSYLGHEADPGAWTLLGTAQVVANGTNVPTPVPVVLDTPLLPGQTQGFYVTVTGNLVMNSAPAPVLGAVCAQNADLQVLVGKNLVYPFGPAFGPRIWNGTIHYTPAGSQPIATNTVLGSGCGRRFASGYEQSALAAFDLNGRTISWLWNGSHYVVTSHAGAPIVTPSTAAIAVAPATYAAQTPFALSSPLPGPAGPTTTLNVCTLGYVAMDIGNPVDWSPTGAELLAFPSTTWACWNDFDQTIPGSGPVLYEEVSGIACVTWSGVCNWNSPGTSNTFQFQFELATGHVRLAVAAVDTAGLPSLIVVGHSPGGPSLDPGNSDLSQALAAGPLPLAAFDHPGLPVVAASRPIVNTTWQLHVGPLPASGVFGITVFGASDPGLPDLAALGLPGCGLRAALDVLTVFAASGASHPYALPLPNVPALAGQDVFTTAAVWELPPWNAFGAITGNGLRGRIGLL